MRTVTFYTKPDCLLCREAETILKDVQQRILFDLVIVDITDNVEACREYRLAVPVVMINGVEHSRYFIDAAKFMKALE